MSCPIHEEVSWVFQLLSWLPNRFCIDTCTPILEKFISYVYTKNNGKNLNEVRLLQYSSSAKEGFQVLLPSSDALGLHTKRCCYQVGCGELNFTDQILANRVGLAIKQCYRQTYCEIEQNCYDGLISCFEGPLGGGGGRVEGSSVYCADCSC